MGEVLAQFTIPLNPITKKNSMQVSVNRRTGKPIVRQSEAYLEYEQQAGYLIGENKWQGIDTPINIKAIYYRATRHRVDITNLHSALHDVLTEYGVIKDDNFNIVKGTDGSRVRIDRENPRTEITITKMDKKDW